MKSFLTIATIAGFAAVMLFGAFLMVHGATHSSCLPNLMGTSECQSVNPLEYVRVHLGALEGLINAIPAFSGIFAAFAMAALLFASAILPRASIAAPQSRSFPSKGSDSHPVQRKFLKWFAIHEKRDPSFAFAASM